jgi:hypothetical protein
MYPLLEGRECRADDCAARRISESRATDKNRASAHTGGEPVFAVHDNTAAPLASHVPSTELVATPTRVPNDSALSNAHRRWDLRWWCGDEVATTRRSHPRTATWGL